MEIVLATNGLIGIGGSETYLLTVAEHLQRLRHQVTLHAGRGGQMSELMESRGLRVAIGEGALPAKCDVALVQDAAMAYTLAGRWPETPQVFRAPSSLTTSSRRRSSRASSPPSWCAAIAWPG